MARPPSKDMWCPTVGVEEEFLLVDPETGVPVNRADEVVAVAREELGLELERELTGAQVEINTTVCRDAEQARRELIEARRSVARAARTVGCRAIAVGAPPLGDATGEVTDSLRYRRIAREFGALAEQQLICGCHVHVAVPDRETAVQVCNHVRPWLPVLSAVTANSPFSGGEDTGFASWRSTVWSRWPVSGPPPVFTSWQHYEEVCDTMIKAGTALDRAMIYWDVRPATELPTVEVRVSDVAATVDEAVLLAALVRALVAQAVVDVERGVQPEPVPQETLRQACWGAANEGLRGSTLDVLSGEPRPLRRQLDDLVTRLTPVFEANGDLPAVQRGLRLLDGPGTGADRQRQAFRTGQVGSLLGMLDIDNADRAAPWDTAAS
ncbi:glutamate--cysteine ligase [Lentzea sp. BCCO 10_0798]|uniref:Putative glutamate--cysteine ligase 2 n=1 Tax=Lentzea kristufekii TaxID=3095430 RepID=A0ABU4TW14_9PSEU|nr:glutamate--cysteine ligase [Lentzea sp. BCCO 10_0798]MDX8052244.1 glutamate--cysteine ligase [Lentzea sp. BCCO 10_0798]